MAEHDFEVQSFHCEINFPAIWLPKAPPFPNATPKYSVTFQHSEMTDDLKRSFMPGREGRMNANSNFRPPVVELNGQESRLIRVWELADYSNIPRDRLLSRFGGSVAVRPWVSNHPLARGRLCLSLETIGLHAGNLETRLEELLEERREQMREKE